MEKRLAETPNRVIKRGIATGKPYKCELLEVSLVIEKILAILELIEDEASLEAIYWFAERRLVQEPVKEEPPHESTALRPL